jgi:hypothetical protein
MERSVRKQPMEKLCLLVLRAKIITSPYTDVMAFIKSHVEQPRSEFLVAIQLLEPCVAHQKLWVDNYDSVFQCFYFLYGR